MWTLDPFCLFVYYTYLYNTLCLLYKSTHIYFITWKIQYTYSVFLTWYQSHYSDFFFTVLSLIGVIPNSRLLPPLQLLLQPFAIKPLTHLSHCLWFRIYSRHHSESRDHCHIVVAVILALIVFLQVPLRSSSANLLLGGNLIVIGGPTRLHAPPKVLASWSTCPTCRWVTYWHSSPHHHQLATTSSLVSR